MGVDPVVLGLRAVDGSHVQGVSEHEGDALARAQVGQPVPGEDALDGHDEVVSVRRDGSQEAFWVAGQIAVQQHLALRVEDADVHRSRVQIDPAVVLVALGVESHGSLLKRLGLQVQPAYAAWRTHRRGPG